MPSVHPCHSVAPCFSSSPALRPPLPFCCPLFLFQPCPSFLPAVLSSPLALPALTASPTSSCVPRTGSKGQIISSPPFPAGAWGDLGGTFVLPNLGHLSAAQREMVGHACPACRRVSSFGGLTSFSLCVQPLQTPIAPLEVDWDASPSADPWERPEETFALQNIGPKDDVCPHLFTTLQQEPLATSVALLDGRASPAGPCGRLHRSPAGRRVAESSQGAAQELLQAAFHTSSLLPDERDPARGSSIPPRGWALSGKTRNRLAHAYNGNSAGQGGESDLEKVTRKIEQVEAALGGKTDPQEVGIYRGAHWTMEGLRDELKQLRKKEEQLREEKNLLLRQQQQPQPAAQAFGRLPPPAADRKVSVAHLFFTPKRSGIRGFLAAKSSSLQDEMRGYVRHLEARNFAEVEVLIIVDEENNDFFLKLIAALRRMYGNETGFGTWAPEGGFLASEPAAHFSKYETFAVEKLPKGVDCSASGISSDPAVEGVDMRSTISELV
uniref:Uncharacterized protein n=1 Tax=Chromera velia CCMP2878 TaxID=1169474 RepID=A0A0G4HL07_9ALVE|eukprot:Cvel_28622.t1-p1 / transcript=Cvel_28622.t1 / gene=Cvel_28622 / organism=Chromera_velia_CCMP2878 / gene_product=hypothetical protein / transcript_product=hypothetical protein / location=Cvel_scaffold3778:9560-13611(-) / protein_length=494 / sequence_SO=supercontig / SO=protein_coding / is_pseudo=false